MLSRPRIRPRAISGTEMEALSSSASSTFRSSGTRGEAPQPLLGDDGDEHRLAGAQRVAQRVGESTRNG